MFFVTEKETISAGKLFSMELRHEPGRVAGGGRLGPGHAAAPTGQSDNSEPPCF